MRELPQQGVPAALILVGGLGTRLLPVHSGPKALALVGGEPFLSHLLRWLHRGGIRRVVLCVGHRSDEVRDFVGDGSSFGLNVAYSVETRPLGTAGALGLAVTRLPMDQRFFALNGDSLSRVDFAGMLREHLKSGARATIALAPTDCGGRYGRVEFDSARRVSGFYEKDPDAHAGFINAGVYLFEREILAGIPADATVSLERDVLPGLAGRGLIAYRTGEYFIDIGIPEDLARAQTELERISRL